MSVTSLKRRNGNQTMETTTARQRSTHQDSQQTQVTDGASVDVNMMHVTLSSCTAVQRPTSPTRTDLEVALDVETRNRPSEAEAAVAARRDSARARVMGFFATIKTCTAPAQVDDEQPLTDVCEPTVPGRQSGCVPRQERGKETLH